MTNRQRELCCQSDLSERAAHSQVAFPEAKVCQEEDAHIKACPLPQAAMREEDDRVRKDQLAPLPAPTGQAAAPKLPGKAGGVYMPPFKLAQLMAAEAAKDRTGAQFQRLTWDALRKSINALVNKVTKANIKLIVAELFSEVSLHAAFHGTL